MDLSRQQGRNFKLQCIPMQRVHVRQGRRWTAVASFSAALQKWLVNMRGKMIFSLDGLEVGQTNYQRFMFVASPFLMAAQWNQRRLIRGDDNEREEGTRVGGSQWVNHPLVTLTITVICSRPGCITACGWEFERQDWSHPQQVFRIAACLRPPVLSCTALYDASQHSLDVLSWFI